MENLRLNKMTKAVFTMDNVIQLREAVVDVFDIFQEVLGQPCVSYLDLKDRLEMLEACKWEPIRNKYLFEDYIGYNHGNFDDKEMTSVVKILLDFISLVEICTHAVTSKIEEKHGGAIALENKVKQMEERIKKTEMVVELQKTHYAEKCEETSRLAANNAQLHETVDQKQKQISQLERNSNVQMWELEKQKLLKESSETISELEKEIQEIRQGREGYKRRMSNIDSSYQKMLMKQKLMSEKGASTFSLHDDDEGSKSTQLSRINFMQDKDIAYLEKQLYELQSSTVGVVGGIKTDFMKLNTKIADVNDGLVDSEFELLSSRMNRVYQAVSEGEIDKAKQVLPPHYRYIENDNFKIKRIKRLSQSASIPSQSVLNGLMDEQKQLKNTKSSFASIEEHTALKKIVEAPTVNPEIVNQRTKKPHPINSLKYFPHMAQKFVPADAAYILKENRNVSRKFPLYVIIDQFGKFKEFDKNGDGCLDLSEIVQVVKELGFNFNTHELQEAMEEVDRDNNHTLDFYEYLLIVDNIYRRNGKAELFKDGLTELNSKNVSKSCVVQ